MPNDAPTLAGPYRSYEEMSRFVVVPATIANAAPGMVRPVRRCVRPTTDIEGLCPDPYCRTDARSDHEPEQSVTPPPDFRK